MGEIVAVEFVGGWLPGHVVIQGVTFSPWAHVWVETNRGTIIDATAARGVKEREKPRHGYFWRSSVVLSFLPFSVRREIFNLLHSQIGKPYDWTWIASYLSCRDWQEDDAWVCSELIAWAMFHVGAIKDFDQNRVTPAQLKKALSVRRS